MVLFHVQCRTLKSLAILDCELLRSIFTYDAAKCLFQLEELFVGRSPLLERVMEASKETVNNKKIILPKLKDLALVDLPLLYSVDFECPSLENLSVQLCPHLSFPTSASDYFHSRNQVQLNDEQHFKFLDERYVDVLLNCFHICFSLS